MQQHCSKYFDVRPPTPGPGWWGSKGQISEHGHVAYQIKWNH